MVPNGAAYDNYPSFANNGTKTPPGGSTESAKYALGMVPADTFPAEWANYLFHGATAGITRLNNDTGSIKKEINSVLSNFNITPDATLNNQLLEALTKLKAEAALAAHPVGSLYWTSSTENPATTFGGGTWTQIKDKFILAAGDTYTNGATGGAATVTLETANLPSHNHTFTGSSHNHTFTGSEHSHSYTPQGSVSITTNPTFTGTSGTVSVSGGNHRHKYFTGGSGGAGADAAMRSSKKESGTDWDKYTDYSGNLSLSGSFKPSGTISGGTYSFTGTAATLKATQGGTVGSTTAGGTIGNTGSGTAHNNMPPYIVKYCWERTA